MPLPDKIIIKGFDTQRIIKDVINIDSAKTYQIDFTPWAEENNTVSSVTWTKKVGSCSISNEILSSNIASALITFNNIGRQVIQVKGASSSEVFVLYLNIYVKDPSLVNNEFLPDYR